MSLPQSRQSPLAHSDLPQEDDPSRSNNIARYDSIQGALGGRRVSQPVPLAYLRSNPDIAPPQPHMPPDSRYAYPSSSSSATQNHQYPYEHQYPPSSSYTTSVYSHNSLPRMRTPHSLSEPPRTPVNQPPQGYGLSYLTYPPGNQYAVPSGMPAPSWSTTYSHYPQSPTDVSVSPELVRVEPMAQASQQDPGPYRTSDAPASPHVDTSRHISGSSRDVGPSESKGKQREGLLPIHRSRNSQEPDYHKLSETYRLLLDNANHSPTLASTLHALPSGLPSSDVLSRLHEFALEGVRQFDSSEQGEPPPRSPSPHLRSQQSKDDGKGSSKRQRTDPSSAVESQKCMGCGATSTPEWRRGPLGPRTLCNACGLVYAKLIKKRGRAEAGRFIEGAASFAASAAETVPSEFNQDFAGGLASGSTGVQQPPHSQQDEDDRDGQPRGASSAEGEGSEDDSYEDLPSHSGSRPQQEDRR